MKINKVEISNFYSLKDVKITFDKYDGIVLIEGINKDTGGSNGSGKSAIIEAVVWGLFGKTIRKSTEEALINNTSKKNCVVKITVNDSYLIERGKKPTFLRFTKQDVELTRENATATQTLIDETLNTNYKVFLASTVFGQQNSIEFVDATPEDKRIIIKNFLNLDYLFDLRESVKHLKSVYSNGIKRCDAVITEHDAYVIKFNKQISHLENLKKQIEESKISAALTYSLNDILDIETKNKNTEWEIAGLAKEAEKLHQKIEDLSKTLDKPDESAKCFSCGQFVNKITNPKEVFLSRSFLYANLEDVENEIVRLRKEIKEPPISSLEYHKILEYKSLQKDITTYEELKGETLDKKQKAHDEKQDLNNKYEIMRFWEKAFSESGIVKYVIKNILDYFNSKVNENLAHLSQGKFFIQFDEELRETITHNDEVISYMSLSGGEKRKVSLAVMLGLQELLKIAHNQKNNIMFFDEVGENLDREGLDGLYILLSELKKDKTLFVITHNNYLKSLMDNAKTITMIKSNGVSKLKGK
jgi:DNA repair exonuclease SbcCD ATPase subunit